MIRIASIAALVLLAPLASANAAAVVGKPAPAFQLTDMNGEKVRLDSFKGKYVVLEWVNFQCPFVGKHYGGQNMQALQKRYTEKGVVWLTICSSAPGKQGHVTGSEAKQAVDERDAAPSRFLLDPKGVVGRAYGAKTTPHMFIIDKDGMLRYNGAIDDDSSADGAKGDKAVNYVSKALDEIAKGETVSTPETKPYGCGVKYAK